MGKKRERGRRGKEPEPPHVFWLLNMEIVPYKSKFSKMQVSCIIVCTGGARGKEGLGPYLQFHLIFFLEKMKLTDIFIICIPSNLSLRSPIAQLQQFLTKPSPSVHEFEPQHPSFALYIFFLFCFCFKNKNSRTLIS